MSLTQIFGIAKRLGIQTVRSKWTFPYLILFPLFFIGIYWFAFSSSNIGNNQTFDLGILNQDKGFGYKVKNLLKNETITQEVEWFPHSADVIEKGFAIEVIEILKEIGYSNESNSIKIFNVNLLNSMEEINQNLEDRDLDIAIVFPQNYTNASLSSVNNFWYIEFGYYLHDLIQSFFPNSPDFPINENATIQILGDNNYLNYKIAKTILSVLLDQYHDLSNFFGTPGGKFSLILNEDYQVAIPKYTFFEMMVPGLIMFGIIIQPSLFSMFLCIEFKPDIRTFDRIRISPLSSSSYIFGSLLIQIPIMLIQTIFLFTSSFILGFEPKGNILLGFLITCSMFPFAASLNYITAAFFSDENVAGTVTGFGAPILGFMTGAFVDAPKIVLLHNSFPTAGGLARDFLLWDLIPLTHGINAIREVLLHDFSIIMVLPDLIANFLLSGIYLVIFVSIYVKMRFSMPK
ncbi:MAG: ABC transporter permease [Candidatus Hodarchaeota archaeon]